MNVLDNKNRFLVFLLFCGLLISIAAGFLTVHTNAVIIVAIAAGIGLSLVSFVKPEAGLLVLVLGMLLSPEIILAQDPSHDIIIRLEDIFLIIVFIAWFTRLTINKQEREAVQLPLRGPIAAYTVVCIIATMLGVMRGELSVLKSFFFLMKYIEYFIIFFMAVNIIKTPAHLKLYFWTLIISCVITTVYLDITTDFSNPAIRTTTLFEGGEGMEEPATLGGFYLIMFSLLMSFIIYSRSFISLILSIVLFVSMIPPFVFAQSRASYFAILPMLASVFLLRRNLKTVIIALLFAASLIPLIVATPLGNVVNKRILYTFSMETSEDIPYEPSTAARISKWKILIPLWISTRPFFGYGVTGVGLVDAQIPRVVGETGLLGLAAFLWLLVMLWKTAYKNYMQVSHPFAQAIALGFLGGYIGLLVQSLTTNTFIIIRIMEPFWLLAAIVYKLPALNPQCAESAHSIRTAGVT
jgi:hypothetical protein